MSDVPEPTTAPHPAVALAAYVEPLVRGRRVAVIGDATLDLGEQLVERGARLVHVYDPVSGRVAEALARRGAPGGRSAAYAVFSEDLGVRDGAFDVVVVTDLSAFDDAPELVRHARRLVGPSGVAVFASPNPEVERWLLPPSPTAGRASGYYELYDMVSLHFTDVKMLGQAPFVGYALVDFASDDPEVSVDTSVLEEPEAPEWYVAIGFEHRLEIDAYALVEVPLSVVARALVGDPVTLPRTRDRVDEHKIALTEARTRIALLGTENEKLREQVVESARVERAHDQASMRAADLDRELELARAAVRQTEERAKQSAELVQRLGGDVLRLETELADERERRRLAAAQPQFDAGAAQALESANARIVELEATIAELDPPTLRSKEAQAQRIAGLEGRIADLEARLSDSTAAQEKLRAQLAGANAAVERSKSDLERANTALDRSKNDIERARADLERPKAELDRSKADLERAKAEVTAARAELVAARARADELAAKVAAVPSESKIDEEHAKEVEALEETLRERGREIARLHRDLREGERVGRELLQELEDLRGPSGGFGSGGSAGGLGNGPGPRASPAGGLLASADASSDARLSLIAQHEADLAGIAERAARAEADLVAASWKLAQLERELDLHKSGKPADASARERELERALVAAQRELAEAREALVRPDRGGPSDAMEDAVLLGQVERAAAIDERSP
jgi:SAM-dependent methyltransferase